MNQVATIIMKYDNGVYHVKLDIDRNVSRRFKGKQSKIVFAVIGDYVDLIKHFGVGKFMKLMDSYDPNFDAMVQSFGV
jgi:hypothetical protein